MTYFLRKALRVALAAGAFTATTLAPSAATAASIGSDQELVDRATLAASGILSDDQEGKPVRNLLPDARAVIICPRVFRVGIILGGGEGGGCVLLARGAQGTWSAPAFYTMAAGSFGPQLGVQDAEVMFLILTKGGLRAVMDNQVRLGAGFSLAVVNLGGGLEGDTTTALNADIVAFARTRGLFAGISLQGSIMNASSEADEAYYGQPVGTVDIVMAMRANNPAADPLRAVLMRYGTPAPAPAPLPPAQAYAPPPSSQPPVYGEQQPYVPPNGQAYAQPGSVPSYGGSAAQPPVQQQTLPPPR